MMYLPGIKARKRTLVRLRRFRGYDSRPAAGEEFCTDMLNCTADGYPYLRTREVRTPIETVDLPQGIGDGEKTCYAAGGGLYYDGRWVCSLNQGEKRLLAMGERILVFPDGICYHTRSGEVTHLEHSTVIQGEVTYLPVTAQDDAMQQILAQAEAPQNVPNGTLWLDESKSPAVLREYQSATDTFVALGSTYVRIEAKGIGTGFAAGDGIRISGSTVPGIDGMAVLHKVSDDAVVIAALLGEKVTCSEVLQLQRSLPQMDHYFVHDNRLWGCSSAENTIYASKLGDPGNFWVYQGLAGDSYSVQVGTPGPFTGIAAYNGSLLFMKERALHRLYGTRPANYQLMHIPGSGMARGSEKSAAVCAGVLYYLSPDGVCAFSGGVPATVHRVFDNATYSDAVGAAYGSHYYLCMHRGAQAELFVLNTDLDLWAKEDDADVMGFALQAGQLRMLLRDGTLCAVEGGEGDVPWMIQSATLGAGSTRRKYIGTLQLRMVLSGSMTVQICENDTGVFRTVMQLQDLPRGSYTIPIQPSRCDLLQVRLHGQGQMQLQAVQYTVEEGSELG